MIDSMPYHLAELVISRWGAENGVKFLSGVISTLVTATQMQSLMSEIEKSSRFMEVNND
jgi:hypothetical protein